MNNIAIEEITAIVDETINITKLNWPQSFFMFMFSILFLFLHNSSSLSFLLINMKESVSSITGTNISQIDEYS